MKYDRLTLFLIWLTRALLVLTLLVFLMIVVSAIQKVIE